MATMIEAAQAAGVLDAKIPAGPLDTKWSRHKSNIRLVNPANKRKYDVIVVGAGLAGASAAATLSELGYKVKCFIYHDSPRRAHSIAAQGGINAAKNYQNDGDSVQRLFYDTIKGGDFRAREANVYRLAEVSVNIIDQMTAQGVPFAREYGGLLSNRSFGGAQVSRTFYARGQTGQQLLLGAYQQLEKEVAKGNVEMYTHHEMLDVVVADGVARASWSATSCRGRSARSPPTRCCSAPAATGTCSTCRRTRRTRTRRRSGGRTSAAPSSQPVLHADPPDVHPGDRAPPVEADADVGVAAQRRPRVGAAAGRRQARAHRHPGG
jgi:hypothetical protein